MGNCGPLLELEDVQRRLSLTAGSDGGLKTIAIADIVGTQDRVCDFDRNFHPMRDGLMQRIDAVARAFPTGEFPPIQVVQVDRAYFAVDGHKRIAAARALGVELIDAHVTQFVSRHPVTAETMPDDLVLLEACERFLHESGLGDARPDVRVDALSAESYHELLEAVKAHGYDLMRTEKRLVDSTEVATHWHDCALLPTLEAAETTGLTERLGSLPSGDLYLAVHRQARTIAGVDCEALTLSAQTVAEQIAATRRPGLRRLLRRTG